MRRILDAFVLFKLESDTWFLKHSDFAKTDLRVLYDSVVYYTIDSLKLLLKWHWYSNKEFGRKAKICLRKNEHVAK